jgi:hypothetical protein
VVESTALEMRHTGNRIGGSNPSLSAKHIYNALIIRKLVTRSALCPSICPSRVRSLLLLQHSKPDVRGLRSAFDPVWPIRAKSTGPWDPTYARGYGGGPEKGFQAGCAPGGPIRRKGQGVALNRFRTLMTCAANHLPPAGAEIRRRFNSSAALFSASSPKTWRSRSARSAASRWSLPPWR